MNPPAVAKKLKEAAALFDQAAEDVYHERFDDHVKHWDDALKVIEELRPAVEHCRERQASIRRRQALDEQFLAFQECAACAAKPGTPTLCPSCLHNRALIERLKARTEVVSTWPAYDRPPGRPDLVSCLHRPMCSGYTEHQRVTAAFYVQNQPETVACSLCAGPLVDDVVRHFSYCSVVGEEKAV